MSHATHSRSARLRAGLREHRAIAAVLAVAAVARAVVAGGYAPALFFPDSWSYVGAAYGESHLGGIRPPGYALAMWGMDVVAGRSLALVTTVQHLAGLAAGLIVYALALR